MVLATVATTIENFTKASPSGDADMIDVMGGGDAFEEQRGDEETGPRYRNFYSGGRR